MTGINKSCPLCAEVDLEPILSRPKSAVLQNRVFATENEAHAARAGQLEIKRCRNCGFIHNAAFDPQIVEYVPEYENEQGNSARFRTHIADLIARIRRSIKPGTALNLVDIGCGQGAFLETMLADLHDFDAQGFGFDTAYRGAEAPGASLRYFRDYFGSKTGNLIPGGEVILVTRHVIEHVPDPIEFLRQIRMALREDQSARLFVETPCTEWIFRNLAVQDFFYEHCNYWTAGSLAFAAQSADFEVIQVDHVFGGQYLWLEAVPSDTLVRTPQTTIGNDLPGEYTAHERTVLSAWQNCLAREAADTRVALWGGGAKGVTMALLLDPDREFIDCIIDINPHKQGGYIPITGHPVLPFKTAYDRGVRTAFVMNPNYISEIEDMLAREQFNMKLIDETMVRT